MKLKTPKIIRTGVQVYEFCDPEAESIMLDFIHGVRGARTTGNMLGISHQQVINMTTSLCRQWIREGRLSFNK